MKEVTNRYYPVGHIIISLNPNYNPNNQIQDTKWQLIEEGRFLQATTNSSRVGEKVIAGLPNITGEFGTGGASKMLYGTSTKGVFQNVDQIGQSGALSNGLNDRVGHIRFNASLSNKIYGRSNTVQPDSIRVYMWQRIA